ncbi:MAG TPA: hypothetical protein VNY52_05410 [Solirubrobacteraceae bacterium]|jgi:hypothetical protein|nr:hypothetical protein [Solirubrobacteraceae bacterium]
MVVLIVVAVVCFGAGVAAASQWLPDLEESSVGTIAFFVVCGLSGAALGLLGVNIDSMVRGLESSGRGELGTLIVTNGLVSILSDSGTVAGLALIAYLLAPRSQRETTQPGAGDPSSQHP